MRKAHYKREEGFTLIEILVVVALIAILAAITIIAINPAKNFADARNAQRSSDVAQILNAMTQFTSQQGQSVATLEEALGFGTAPAAIEIGECGTAVTSVGSTAGNLDLGLTTGPIVDEIMVAVPLDPSGGTAGDTGYDVCVTTGGRVEVSAPNAENGATISVRR